ncbi:MAG TPA: carbamoyltransferase C-terminal domain-containing protein [Thermoanaerobaculia bacterium]|nr:carbamoyltransferase C-terminal domain-containing protein [Thermoanaerobaculia bacterium]
MEMWSERSDRQRQRTRSGKPAERGNVLGLCFTGHGASAALISPEHGIRALLLERFTGQKDALIFGRQELEGILSKRSPVEASIHWLLVAAFRKFPPSFVFEETFRPFLEALLAGLPIGPEDIDLVVTSNCSFTLNQWWPSNLRKLQRCFPQSQVFLDIEHHAIHQRQAFLGSSFAEAAVLTVDTCGEDLKRLGGAKLAITLGEGRGTDVRVFHEHVFPVSSPGRIYAAFTSYLGFRQGQEGKTMGLAPYGEDTVYRHLILNLTLFPDGSFRFLSDRALFQALRQFTPEREPGEPLQQVHADVAYAGQALLEDIVLNAVHALARRSRSGNLCIAGGVGLNSVANEKALRASRFERLYVMPNCGDPGQALGCALFGARHLLGQPWSEGVSHDYLGPCYSDSDVETALRRSGLELRRLEAPERFAARLLAQGRIVGWFQGGSEFGPRALGNRSILADPRPARMKDHLNHQVKHRESFRPFAPAVLEADASAWFDVASPSPYMLRVVPVLAAKRSVIPAVTHVDGTARVQTVSRTTNPRFHRLLEEFRNVTGVPVLLNTSFNVNERPIVETPADAVECYLSTGIDALVLHDYVATKPGIA